MEFLDKNNWNISQTHYKSVRMQNMYVTLWKFKGISAI